MAVPQRVRIAEQLVRRLEWDDLDRGVIRRLVESAREEVARENGRTPHATSHGRHTVEIVATAETVACGTALVGFVAHAFGLKGDARTLVHDGMPVASGTVIAALAGPVASLRPAADVLQAFVRRLSGIAAFARTHVDALGNGRTRLLDSGAFTPAWRALEKYALGRGGTWTGGEASERFRIDGSDRSTTDLETAVRSARGTAPEVPVEIAVCHPDTVGRALAASPDVIRLERFSVDSIRRAVACVNGRVFVEAHGGVDLSNIADYAGLGLDFLSIDGLVSDARWAQCDAIWRD